MVLAFKIALSVWVGMTVYCVIPVKTGIQGPWIPDRVGDDGGAGDDGVNCGFMKIIQL